MAKVRGQGADVRLIAAFESSHAVAALRKDLFAKGEHVLVNLSGRGDKDMESASRILRL